MLIWLKKTQFYLIYAVIEPLYFYWERNNWSFPSRTASNTLTDITTVWMFPVQIREEHSPLLAWGGFRRLAPAVEDRRSPEDVTPWWKAGSLQRRCTSCHFEWDQHCYRITEVAGFPCTVTVVLSSCYASSICSCELLALKTVEK